METLSADPLLEIFSKFSNPLDIVAFELSSKNAKKAVEQYDLYKAWEKRLMPNDDARIIATFLFDHRLTKKKKGEYVFTVTFSYDYRQIISIDLQNLKILVEETYLPILIQKKNIFSKLKFEKSSMVHDWYLSVMSVQLEKYDFFIYLYEFFDSNFLDYRISGYDTIFDYENIGELFTNEYRFPKRRGFKEIEDKVYRNQKYRILATYLLFNNLKSIRVRNSFQNYKIYDLDDKKIMDIYELFDNNTLLVKDIPNGKKLRIVRSCIQCNSTADLIEKNGDKIFCGTFCQRKFYE